MQAPPEGVSGLVDAWEQTDLPRNHPPFVLVINQDTGERLLVWPCGQHYAVSEGQRPRRRFHRIRSVLERQYARWFGRVPGSRRVSRLPTTCTACQVLGSDELLPWAAIFAAMPESYLQQIACRYALALDPGLRSALKEKSTKFIRLPQAGPLSVAVHSRGVRYAGTHAGQFYLTAFDPTVYGPDLVDQLLAAAEESPLD